MKTYEFPVVRLNFTIAATRATAAASATATKLEREVLGFGQPYFRSSTKMSLLAYNE